MAYRIQLRRDTSANWLSNNPILLQGEFGYESDTGNGKIGDGQTVWASLSYYGGTGPTGSVDLVDLLDRLDQQAPWDLLMSTY